MTRTFTLTMNGGRSYMESTAAIFEKGRRNALAQYRFLTETLEIKESELLDFSTFKVQLCEEWINTKGKAAKAALIEDILDAEELIAELDQQVQDLNNQLDELETVARCDS